ncbi:MAG: hypothetical protein CME71_02280 [Halobacteriovorax sp.]|nr:hypothetical protein [Halobacteriovorax sp.]|tara:strand:+ start:347 stop:727 length:381 start_codon:yes stop_codon:yes gene_type:complete
MNEHTSKNFFLILSLVIPILFGVILPWPELLTFPTWPSFFGLLCLCISFSPQRIRDRFFYPVFKISHLIGIMNQFLIMGLIFYLLFVPIALIRKIFKMDSLRLKSDQNNSFWRKPDENFINFDRPY